MVVVFLAGSLIGYEGLDAALYGAVNDEDLRSGIGDGSFLPHFFAR